MDRIVPNRYAITLSSDSNERELTVYAGSEDRVFNQNSVQRFLFDSRLLFNCPPNSSNTENTQPQNLNSLERTAKALNEKTEVANLNGTEVKSLEDSNKKSIGEEGPQNETRKPTENRRVRLKAADHPFQDSEEKLNEKLVERKLNKHLSKAQIDVDSTLLNDKTTSAPTQFSKFYKCKVDLMFIIDTSQSVADEFQKQLQFAVDLVKRLPNEDFEHRVQVSAVSFHRIAKLEFPFGKLLK